MMEDPWIFDASDETVFPETANEFSAAATFGHGQNGIETGRHLLSQFGAPLPPPKHNGIAWSSSNHLSSEFHQGDAMPIPRTENAEERFDQGFDSASHAVTETRMTEDIHETLRDDENSQQNAASSVSKSPRKRMRISQEEWQSRKPDIKKLYLTKDKRLTDVMDIMKKDYKFNPSRTAYIQQLKIWRFQKKLPDGLARIMWRIIRQRKGKSTAFRYRGSIVPYHKIGRVNSAYVESESITAAPPSLSVSTPENDSNTHSSLSIRIRDQSCSSKPDENPDRSFSDSQRESCRDRVVIHQHDRNRPEKEPEPDLIEKSLSIKQRLADVSWNLLHINEELREHRTILPLVGLLPESVSNCDPVALQTAELLLEVVLTKCEEMPDGQHAKSPESPDYVQIFTRSLILQRKYGQAGLVLDGIYKGPDFPKFCIEEQIKVLKMRLQVVIGDDFEEPRLLAKVEACCNALIAKETSDRQRSSRGCFCSKNLIPAFLFRLHGIKSRDLDSSTVSEIVASLKDQLSSDRPPLSAIWAAQQHVRLCLCRQDYDTTKQNLKLIREALVQRKKKAGRRDHEKKSTEAILTEYLDRQLQSLRHQRGRAQKPDIVDVYCRYPIDNPVDEIWLQLFKSYVRDDPHHCPDKVKRTTDLDEGKLQAHVRGKPRACPDGFRRTKDMDEQYWR